MSSLAPSITEADKRTGDAVQQSYGRCCVNPAFFDDFYTEFTAKSPKIREKFRNTDFTRQKQLLRQGLGYMIMYFQGSAIAADVIDKLGTSHARTQLDISPDLYALWLEALLKTVARYDRKLTPELEKGWRTVMSRGVNTMKAKY